MNGNQKTTYICGPLTELDPEIRPSVKWFYQQIADACQKITGLRAFVPHEHYDPQKHAHFTPSQVDEAERNQVCNKTSVLIVVAIAPSWGGGIEVEMANEHDVPIVILCERKKLQQDKVSRLLRGNPAVKAIVEYNTQEEALLKLRKTIRFLVASPVS